jgi:hypothetical protein
MDSNWKKAQWIAEELEADVEEVYDILLGNITEPQDLVTDVNSLSQNYDFQKQRFFSPS